MLEQKKEELQKLVDQYNELQKTLQQLGQQILKCQGAVEVLQEQANKKGK